MRLQKGFIALLVGIAIILVLAIGLSGYIYWQVKQLRYNDETPVPYSYGNKPTPSPTPPPQGVVCAQDAKQCIDGSYVSRQGPMCEFAACPTSEKQIPTPMDSTSIDLIFKYGVGGKNELNTFANTYTKDIVIGPSITVPFRLSEEEHARILTKITDLHIFDQKKPALQPFRVIPCSSYYLKVRTDSSEKELSWSNCGGEIIPDAWTAFTDFMISLIESKEEYKKLPPARGGYL
ncbi:MAG: hypothetical protein Q8Q94_04005 [bacterium]|nr:hypothetical protein [bacterium]